MYVIMALAMPYCPQHFASVFLFSSIPSGFIDVISALSRSFLQPEYESFCLHPLSHSLFWVTVQYFEWPPSPSLTQLQKHRIYKDTFRVSYPLFLDIVDLTD